MFELWSLYEYENWWKMCYLFEERDSSKYIEYKFWRDILYIYMYMLYFENVIIIAYRFKLFNLEIVFFLEYLVEILVFY